MRANRCICGSTALNLAFSYDKPPQGESPFPLPEGQSYKRRYLRCESCGHFLGDHDFDLGKLYSEGYVNATYKDENGMRRTFDRVISLDPSKSDNRGRCERITKYAEEFFGSIASTRRKLLDVGSGVGVFPYQIRKHGWEVTALDPDSRAAAHIRSAAEVPVICGDFMKTAVEGKYDVITFNKVIEHVSDPVAMLAKAVFFLLPGGFVYVELPDGEAAARDGKEREEFFIEHDHVFSRASIGILSQRAGFKVDHVERLREPSGKYTLRAFVSVNLDRRIL